MKVKTSWLRQQMHETLAQNFSDDNAERIVDFLLWADMSGVKTHGIAKMTTTEPIQDVKPQHAIRIERETKLSQIINAGANPAPLASQVATEAAIVKAKEHGFGIVGVHNTFSSNGALAYYAEEIAKNDLIGVVMARSPASVAVFGGIDPVLGTNPVGVSFPTNSEPIVFDMATSAMTWAGLVLAKARGEQIPEGIAIDKNGNPTTSPADAMDGALLPFDGGHKGAGLGLMVETFAGPLVGAGYGFVGGEWGCLFMAIDPGLLVDVAEFKKNSSELVEKLKAARKAEGKDEIRLPGERAAKARRQAEISGEIDVDAVVLRQLGYIE